MPGNIGLFGNEIVRASILTPGLQLCIENYEDVP